MKGGSYCSILTFTLLLRIVLLIHLCISYTLLIHTVLYYDVIGVVQVVYMRNLYGCTHMY